MNICKNLCLVLKAKRNTKEGMYETGHRYCTECDAFFKTYEVFCLCCGMRMRTKGRNKPYVDDGKSDFMGIGESE